LFAPEDFVADRLKLRRLPVHLAWFLGSAQESEKLVDLRDSRVAGVAVRLAG
jgi:hypothetical protein